jgi:hypothetical protein
MEEDIGDIERGSPAPPASRDDQLIRLMNMWDRKDDEFIARSFAAAGDDAIESFLERHTTYLREGDGQRLTEYQRSLERLSQAYAEGERGDEHHESPATRLANLLKKHVVPVIRQTLGAGYRVKSARGGTDRVPGYAQERQRTETTRARQSMKNDIEDQIRTMPAFSHHQNAQNSNFRNPDRAEPVRLRKGDDPA